MFSANLPTVRAQLIALDHRGFRTVLIEKLQPGPFGFYIATGMLNQKRGELLLVQSPMKENNHYVDFFFHSEMFTISLGHK